MIISHKHRFIFLQTEKTGGTSLTTALQKIMGDEDIAADMSRPPWAKYSPIHHGALKRHFPARFGLHTHATAAQVRAIVGSEKFGSYFKFAVERNPWDRQVSLYFHREWKKQNANLNFDRDLRSFLYRNSEYVRLHNWKNYAIGNDVVVDQVLRYENLADDVAQLSATLGLKTPLKLPKLRKYTADRPHYSTYYTAKSRALVAKWYGKEIAAMGFVFDDQAANKNANQHGLAGAAQS